MVQVLVLRPGHSPQSMELDDTRIEDDGAAIVGGTLEFIRVTGGPSAWGIYAVLDESAVNKRLPVTAVTRHRNKDYLLRGTCFFTAIDRQGIRSLTDDEVNSLRKKFSK